MSTSHEFILGGALIGSVCAIVAAPMVGIFTLIVVKGLGGSAREAGRTSSMAFLGTAIVCVGGGALCGYIAEEANR